MPDGRREDGWLCFRLTTKLADFLRSEPHADPVWLSAVRAGTDPVDCDLLTASWQDVAAAQLDCSAAGVGTTHRPSSDAL